MNTDNLNNNHFFSSNSTQNEKHENSIRVEGVLKSIRFQKDDFIIGTIVNGKEKYNIKGSLYGVKLGESLILHCSLENHPKYGSQYVVHFWERPLPNNKHHAIAFLSSSLVKGCSKKLATTIVEALGDNAIERIEKEGKDALTNIKGIGEKKALAITENVRNAFTLQRIAKEFKEYGITLEMLIPIYKKYELLTSEKLKENPYMLTEHANLNFFEADEIALRMGIKPFSSCRIKAVIMYTINNMCYARGHTFIPEEMFFAEVLNVMNKSQPKNHHIGFEEIEQIVYQLDGYKIVIHKGKVYPKKLYECEENVANRISRIMLTEGDFYSSSQIDALISDYQKENRIILAEQQREAIRQFINQPIIVLTGGPGTGKTTVVKAMVEIYKKMNPKKTIALAAPTGKASRKLSEVTNMQASTMHRLIGYNGEFVMFDHLDPLSHGLFILDEMSMTDIVLASLVFDAIKSDSKVVLVGDVDQLPSVGAGNVLRDIISSGVPTVRLEQVFRQALESQIVTNAHRTNKGLPLQIDTTKNDFYFIEEHNVSRVAEFVIVSVQRFLKKGYKMSDILVLAPMKKGQAGVHALNERIREKVNPPEPTKNEFKLKARTFREGDKIIQMKNDDEKGVSNGDMAIVISIESNVLEDGSIEQSMLCDFGDKQVTYYKEDLKNVELGYVITIHKSQGGESPIVIMPVVMEHSRMLMRNLLYTGLTRAKEIVVLIGSPQAYLYGVQNNQIISRNSSLGEKLEKRLAALNQYSKVKDTKKLAKG